MKLTATVFVVVVFENSPYIYWQQWRVDTNYNNNKKHKLSIYAYIYEINSVYNTNLKTHNGQIV